MDTLRHPEGKPAESRERLSCGNKLTGQYDMG